MQRVKVIFFDAAGTLIHLPRGVGFHYASVAARHGWNTDAEAIGRSFRAAWKAMPTPVPSHRPRMDDDRGWWRELVDLVLADAGAPDGFDRVAYFEELYEEFSQPGVWELYPEVLAALEALKPHYRLAILSNFDPRLRRVLDHLSVLSRFSLIVLSSEAGADKPDPWIFEHALAQANVTTDEALLVGDDLDCDVAGARRAGWHAFHIDRPRTTFHNLVKALSEARSGS
jgi:putative hydrolase of the HAD superfamily